MTLLLKPQPGQRVAAIYLRISYKNRNAVARQREDLIAICERNGWDYVIYEDYDTSGWTPDADKAFRDMLADMKAGLISVVLAWQTDRLTRQGIESEEFMAIAQDHEVQVTNLTGVLRDLSDPQDAYAHRGEANAAILESAKISLRTRRAAIQTAEQGRAHWPCRPFGFTQPKRNGLGVELVPEEAALIRQAYLDVLHGRSMAMVAHEWNAAGFSTPTREIQDPDADEDDPDFKEKKITVNGNPWSGDKIRALLVNPRNAALREHTITKKIGKKRIIVKRVEQSEPAKWPAIVDVKIYRGVVAKLKSNTKHPNAWVRQHLLSGMAKCGREGCDGTMNVNISTKKNDAYVCSTCTRVRRDKAKVDTFVMSYVLGKVYEAGLARKLDGGVDTAKLDAREAELDGIEAEMRKAVAAGMRFDAQDYARIETERQQIADTRAMASVQHEADHLLERLMNAADAEAEWTEVFALDERRAVIDRLVTITIMPGQPGGRAPMDYALIVTEPKL